MAMMASAIATFSSCGDELPEPQMKPRTAVTVNTDWSACGLENEPSSYFMSVNDEVSTVSGNTQQLTLKSDNDYSFLLYTGSSSVTVSDNFASVGAAKFLVDDANAINGNPDVFCYGSATEAALTGDAKTVNVAMKRITRKLNVTLTHLATYQDAEGKEATIQGGYAILTNAYSAYNLSAGVATTPVSAVSEISVNNEDHTITVPFNLLGLDLDEKAEMTYVLSLSDGTTRTLVSDMTDLLAGFNDGDMSDVNLSVEAPEEDDFTFAYDHVYMFGGATPGGWSMGDSPILLTKVNSYTFMTEVQLTAGEFKFPLNNDWGCDWIMPTVANAPITHTACQLVKDGASFDYKWNVSEAGRYKIVLNVKDMTMTATKLD